MAPIVFQNGHPFVHTPPTHWHIWGISLWKQINGWGDLEFRCVPQSRRSVDAVCRRVLRQIECRDALLIHKVNSVDEISLLAWSYDSDEILEVIILTEQLVITAVFSWYLTLITKGNKRKKGNNAIVNPLIPTSLLYMKRTYIKYMVL